MQNENNNKPESNKKKKTLLLVGIPNIHYILTYILIRKLTISASITKD